MSDVWCVLAQGELDSIIEILARRHVAEELGVKVVELGNNNLQVRARVLSRVEINNIVESVIRRSPGIDRLISADKAFHDTNNLKPVRSSPDGLMIVSSSQDTTLSDLPDLVEFFGGVDEVESNEPDLWVGNSDIVQDLLAFMFLGVVAVCENYWLIL